jgi:hypothetical protein
MREHSITRCPICQRQLFTLSPPEKLDIYAGDFRDQIERDAVCYKCEFGHVIMIHHLKGLCLGALVDENGKPISHLPFTKEKEQ